MEQNTFLNIKWKLANMKKFPLYAKPIIALVDRQCGLDVILDHASVHRTGHQLNIAAGNQYIQLVEYANFADYLNAGYVDNSNHLQNVKLTSNYWQTREGDVMFCEKLGIVVIEKINRIYCNAALLFDTISCHNIYES